MQCPACGAEVIEQAVYCHKCGERVSLTKDDFSDNPRIAEEPVSEPAEAFKQAALAGQQVQNQPEEELWRGGYSPKAMFAGWTVSGLADVVLLVGGLFFWSKLGAWGWFVLLLLMLLPWLYFFAVLCYRRMSVHYLLTTQRLIHESGILRRVNNRIEVLDMDDITFEQGVLERLAGVGTIRILSHDRSNPDLVLPGIENVKKVAGLFDNARLAERRRRGLHVEQI